MATDPSDSRPSDPDRRPARTRTHGATGHRGRLAVFLYDLEAGGSQARTLALANGIAARGVPVDLVLVRDDGPLRPDVSERIRVVVLEPGWTRLGLSRRRSWRKALATAPSLGAYLRREGPEALLSGANHVNRTAAIAWRLARVPTRLVLRVSNSLSAPAEGFGRPSRRLRAWIARRVYPWADAFVAVSGSIAEDLVAATGVPRERVTRIYNPISVATLEAKAAEPPQHPWLRRPGPPVVLGVGRLRAQKDFATLVRAFARVRARRPLRLVIFGEGRERAALESLVRGLGVASDVDLAGFDPNPWRSMRRASVFVLSSRWEGLPAVLIEALACGCPVVSTDCPGGPAEILAEGAFGRLVPVGDEAAMARAIEETLDADPDREALRRRAGCFALQPAVEAYLRVLFGQTRA